MVTLKDVANAVGVSPATVSYVINGTGSVSEAVSKRVLAAAKQLNYRPNRQAQAMRTGRSKTIGLILPDITNPYFPGLAQKLEKEARKRGFAIVLIDCQNDLKAEAEAFIILQQQGVDGIIWCPAGDNIPDRVETLLCPLVLIDRPLTGFDTVHANYYDGGALAAQHAKSLGHKKIGLLSGPQIHTSAQQRRQGFLDCAKDALEIVWDIEVPFCTKLTEEAEKALAQNEVSLIVAADDLIALGAIESLRSNNLHVPQDVSLIGFDDIMWASMLRPSLTTIAQPLEEIADHALELISKKIFFPEEEMKSIVLDMALVERESCTAIA